MTLGRHSGTTTVTQAVDLMNNGTSACVLNGYPGVNLVGVAHGVNQYTWTLQWATAPHSPVTLEPGGSAHFSVVYVPAGAKAVGGKATVSAAPTGSASVKATAKPSVKASAVAKVTTKASAKAGSTAKASVAPSKSAATASPVFDIEVLDISITLPNTYSQDEAAWNASLVLQDKVAHAQTYVTPFVPGAD
jgi:hypothetical protein